LSARGGSVGDAWPSRTADSRVFALCRSGSWPSHVWPRPCPHAYPRPTAQPKQGPFPPAVCRRLHRYYEPLGLPPGTTPFRHRLIGAASSDVDRRGGSLLFRSELSLRAVLHTPGVSSARFRYGALSVAFAAK
jgi:hypothetical protein